MTKDTSQERYPVGTLTLEERLMVHNERLKARLQEHEQAKPKEKKDDGISRDLRNPIVEELMCRPDVFGWFDAHKREVEEKRKAAKDKLDEFDIGFGLSVPVTDELRVAMLKKLVSLFERGELQGQSEAGLGFLSRCSKKEWNRESLLFSPSTLTDYEWGVTRKIWRTNFTRV